LVVNDGSLDFSSDLYVIPSSSQQPCFSFSDYLDLSYQSPAISCNEFQYDALRSEEKISAEPSVRTFESDALDNQIQSVTDSETILTEYFNPEPGDLIWNQISQGLETRDYTESTESLPSSGLNFDFDWINPIDSADMLCPVTFSVGPQSPAPPAIDYSATQFPDLIASSEMPQSVTDTSPRKRSRPNHSSSPESDQKHKHLKPTASHPCRWATCLEIFDRTSKLR